MALYLVRHGETEWNRMKRFQSRTEVPLNATGIAQAGAIHDEFKRRGLRWAAVRCSPMERARHTAQIILEGTGMSAVVEPSFIELSMGEFEGWYEADLAEKHGPAYQAWRDSQYIIAPPGGESILTGAERVRPALLALAPLAEAGDVLIVAHQAVNMAMKVALSGETDVDSAGSFRQHNDQVDVWDMAARQRLETFRVEPRHAENRQPGF
jgi:probable phosphoglycerate mutase